jgi:hypothetical protein
MIQKQNRSKITHDCALFVFDDNRSVHFCALTEEYKAHFCKGVRHRTEKFGMNQEIPLGLHDCKGIHKDNILKGCVLN